MATCGTVAPVGVDQVRCRARPEMALVMVDSVPLVYPKVSALPVLSMMAEISQEVPLAWPNW